MTSSFDLSAYSPQQLDALIAAAKKAKREALKPKRTPASEVKAALATIAKQHGYSLDELFGGKKRTSSLKGAQVPAKYRNAATGEEWTGRGKQPKWLAAELAKGRNLGDFAI